MGRFVVLSRFVLPVTFGMRLSWTFIGVVAVQYWLYNGELQGLSVRTALFVIHLTFVRMFETLIGVQGQPLVVFIAIGDDVSGNPCACGGIAEICVRVSGAEIIDVFCFLCIFSLEDY